MMTEQSLGQEYPFHTEPHTIDEILRSCQAERSAYRSDQSRSSPGCVELFRRAFAHDQEAWAALRQTFEPLVRTWIGPQQQLEIEDVLQETFLAFARYAPQHPELVSGEEIDRVLGFLRRCAKTALLTLLRHTHADRELDAQLPAAPANDDTELRAAIRARLEQLLETDHERQVFFLRFECALKPQQIAEAYDQQFPDVAALYDSIQRITRRLRKDAVLRELYGLPSAIRQKPDSAASLEIRIITDEQEQAMPDDPCTLGEDVLLDYLVGVAPTEVCRAVERSPACVAAAHAIAAEWQPLLRAFQRLSCPDAETLIAYQEHRLDSSAQLLAHRHVGLCPLCQEEYALLARIDATPLDRPTGWARRIIEALFQSPLGQAQSVRGALLRYTAPQVLISISTRQTQGHPRSWVLRGQARTPAGQRVASIEQVLLRALDSTTTREYQAEIETNGSFVFRDLPPQDYELHLLTAQEEIVIRRIVVGEEHD